MENVIATHGYDAVFHRASIDESLKQILRFVN